jgi:hypothetical protein
MTAKSRRHAWCRAARASAEACSPHRFASMAMEASAMSSVRRIGVGKPNELKTAIFNKLVSPKAQNMSRVGRTSFGSGAGRELIRAAAGS